MPDVLNRQGHDRLREPALRLATEAEVAGIPRSAPLADTRIDAAVQNLPAFPVMAGILRRSSTVRRLYGSGFAERWTLAWVYGAIPRRDRETAWDLFWNLLVDPVWHQISLANLTYFSADANLMQFADGLEIRTRSRPELTERTGWTVEDLQATLGEDWSRGLGGTSDYVMLCEESRQKTPEEPLGSLSLGTVSMHRLLQALRLHGAGDIGHGPIFMGTVDWGFRLSPMGLWSSSPDGSDHFGQEYVLSGTDVSSISSLYRQLATFEARHSAQLSNVTTGLGRFRSVYQRSLGGGPDRLIDDMIAMEALLGTTGPELTYSLAVHGSGLLADADDKDRLVLFHRIRSFYDTRSKLVHGASLRPKHHADIGAEPDLRDIVRRLLRGFLNLCDSKEFYPNRSFYKELDATLLDGEKRARLFEAMNAGSASTPAVAPEPRIASQWVDQPPSSAEVRFTRS